jgi:DNA-binding YbaB/EbfC family protein
MGSGFAKKKKQNKMIYEQLNKMQEELQNLEVTGTAANGLVTIKLTGEHELKQVKIKPECVDKDDIEGLETLIKAAYEDALKQIRNKTPSTPNLSGFLS